MADKMIRCPEGHFYDPAKHTNCPWCALPADPDAAGKTKPIRPGADLGAGVGAAKPVPGATVHVGRMPGGVAPVVGWLVCLEGPDRGRDFRLHAEKNFIGRSPSMDVCIPSDESISRERHGVIIFDPKKPTFWVLPGDASGLVYLNGEIVHSPTEMKLDDTLEIGKSKLVLIPFCGDQYNWPPS